MSAHTGDTQLYITTPYVGCINAKWEATEEQLLTQINTYYFTLLYITSLYFTSLYFTLLLTLLYLTLLYFALLCFALLYFT